MSNHFHIVVDYDPQAKFSWTDEEIADRWLRACPPKVNGKVDELRRAVVREQLLNNPEELIRVRDNLGNLSIFMKLLKNPISRRANIEDGCTGHFFEKRFWSGAILDEEALVASMAYVDLNPIRAKIAKSIEESANTSISERLTVQKLTKKRLNSAMKSLVQGLEDENASLPTLATYIDHLNVIISSERNLNDKEQRWVNQVTSIGKRQRAYGAQAQLNKWLGARKLRRLESALP